MREWALIRSGRLASWEVVAPKAKGRKGLSAKGAWSQRVARARPRATRITSVCAGPRTGFVPGPFCSRRHPLGKFQVRGLRRHTLLGPAPGRRGGWGERPAVGVGSEGLCGKCRCSRGDEACAQYRDLLSTTAGLSAGRSSRGPTSSRS